jgi:tetratricopeptide (TPR) repeat protein
MSYARLVVWYFISLSLVGLGFLVFGRAYMAARFGAFELLTIGLPLILLALFRALIYPALKTEMLKFIFNATTVYIGNALVIFTLLTLFVGSPWGLLAGGVYLAYESIPQIALYWTARGQYDRALKFVNAVMRLLPGSARLYGVRGMIRSQQKDDAGSADDYTEAITRLKARKSPRDRATLARYYAGRLEALLKLRDFDQALEDADTVIRMQPDSSYGFAQRSITRLHRGDYDDALDDIEYALKINTEPSWNGTLYNTRGLAKYALNDYDAAMADYETALNVPVSAELLKLVHPGVLSNQGIVYFMRQDYAAALAKFNQAKAIDPDSKHARGGLAVTRFITGDRAAAFAEWRGLVAGEPQFMDVAYVRERYYKWSPPLVEAAEDLIAALKAG